MNLCLQTYFAAHHQVRFVPACRLKPSKSVSISRPTPLARCASVAFTEPLFFVLSRFVPLVPYHHYTLPSCGARQYAHDLALRSLNPSACPAVLYPYRPPGFLSERSGLANYHCFVFPTPHQSLLRSHHGQDRITVALFCFYSGFVIGII
jgi:hypothetical protein